MNKHLIISSALSVALLLPAAAVLADTTASASASTDAQVNLPHDEVEVDSHHLFHLKPQVSNQPTRVDDATSINETNTINVKQQIRENREQKREDHQASTTEMRMEHAGMKADAAIDARIKSLTELSTRIAGIKVLATSTVQALQVSLTAEINVLNALKAKLSADTSTTTMKMDAESITKANRVYLLVEPKARIAAAAARITALVSQYTQLSTKLDTRITAAATAGKDMTAAHASLTDFNAKVADAKVQADAAVSLTVNLQADNGDKTVMTANNAALKQARQKLQAAEADLKAARKDAESIAKAVKGTGVTATTTATTEAH